MTGSSEQHGEQQERQRVEFSCANGHSQVITYVGFPLETVSRLVGLLDGTSELFIHKPGAESSIGKCGICGCPVQSSVVP